MFVTPKEPPSSPSSSSSSTTRNNASSVSGIVGAVAGLTVALAGFVLYQNRRRIGEHGSDTKQNLGKGDITVAGNTFTGDTNASSTDGDDTSTKSCRRTGKLWTNPDDKIAIQTAKASVVSSRQASVDFEKFVSSGDDWGSMSDALSDALASMADADGSSQFKVQPLHSTQQRLKENIEDMKMELHYETNVRRNSTPRLRTVAEIEQLLADAEGEELDR
jgi:hypothetical protein